MTPVYANTKPYKAYEINAAQFTPLVKDYRNKD